MQLPDALSSTGEIPPIVYVIGATAVVLALARYAPKIGGLVVIALVAVMLLVASERGLL